MRSGLNHLFFSAGLWSSNSMGRTNSSEHRKVIITEKVFKFVLAPDVRAQRPGPGFCYPWQAHINLHFLFVPFSMFLNTRLPRGAILRAGLAFVRSLGFGLFQTFEFIHKFAIKV